MNKNWFLKKEEVSSSKQQKWRVGCKMQKAKLEVQQVEEVCPKWEVGDRSGRFSR